MFYEKNTLPTAPKHYSVARIGYYDSMTLLQVPLRVSQIRQQRPPDSGKAIIFRAKAKVLGRSQQPKMKKIVLIKRKNGIFTNNYWVG